MKEIIEKKFNGDKSEFIKSFETFAGGNLKNLEDIKRIIEAAFNSGSYDKLENISFTGKYLHGIFSIIKRGESAVDEEILKKYSEDYAKNLEKFLTEFKELLENSSDFTKEILSNKYLEMNHDTMNSLSTLFNDLNYLKMYFNDLKRD